MYLTVSNAQPGGKILTSYLTDLGLKSISLAPPPRSGTVLISVQTKVSLYLMYNGAGRIANAVDDNVPKSFVKSVIDLSCINNIS